VKRVRGLFEHPTHAAKALRELKLLRLLGGHEQILRLHEVVLPGDPRRFDDLAIVTDHVEFDLFKVVWSQKKPLPLLQT